MSSGPIEAWLVEVTEPGRRGTWQVLRTRAETAIKTAQLHRNKGSEVKLYDCTVTVNGELEIPETK